MSLLDIAKSIKKEGFDPRKDSANGPAPIPAGTYPVVLKKATFNVSDKGWESLGYQFEILTEWNGKNLDWAVERTMKFFIKALVLAGDSMQGNEEDGKALEEALKRKAVGCYYNLVISVTKGKDGREFRNYDLEEEAQPLTEADIDDDDLPF